MKLYSNSFLFILKLFVLSFVFFSCSKYETTEPELPNTNLLTVQNIKTDLAIVNLNVNQNEFDNMMENYSDDIEIEGFYFMYTSDLDSIIKNEPITISIKGSSTAAYVLKSLSINFDNKLDNSGRDIIAINKSLERHHYNKISKISLRNSGNDFGKTFIKDISYTQLAIDMYLDLELSHYRPTQVFINNKYYGFLNLRTEKSKKSLANLLDVDKDNLNIIKINHLGGGQEEIEFKSGDHVILQELVDAVESGNTEELKKLVDINSFADYIVFQDFIGNSDWPFNNTQIYNITDSLFRFYLFDLDFAGTRDNYFASKENDFGFLYKMYTVLIQDEDILRKLQETQNKMVNYCSDQRFYAIVDKNAGVIENEIIYNISKYAKPKTNTAWYLEIEKLLTQFQLRRQNYIDKYM